MPATEPTVASVRRGVPFRATRRRSCRRPGRGRPARPSGAIAVHALLSAALSLSMSAAANGPFDPGAPVVVEGDILVAPGTARGVGAIAGERRWVNGEIPYTLHPTLDGASVRAIDGAVARWNAVGGVTLVEIAADEPLPFDHLVFRVGPGCASWVGRQGGPQEVWVAPSCTLGSVMHEIGHALGLEHEHTRPDRDEHVRVLWDNIVPEKRHNFALAPAGVRAFDDYDLASIMHYGSSNFSIDGAPTLVPRGAVPAVAMGQRDGPSAGDLAAVARLYASDLALSVGTDDARLAREATLFVTNQHPQGAHDVRVALDAPGAVVAGGDAGWRCEAADGRLECRLQRLGGHADSRLVLALATPRDPRTLAATLRSKTPDLDPANNGVDGGVPTLARASFADPAFASDEAGGAPEAVSALGGAGAPTLLALSALALGRRRARRY